jgi:MoaD family protein
MQIKLRYFGFFEDLAGRKEESLGFTKGNMRIGDIINILSEKYGTPFIKTLINPNTNQIREGCILLLNDTKGYLGEQIKDGDVISMLPVLAGG